MQLTTFSDYTFRVLIYLGLQHGKLVTIAEVARAYAVSENHLMKVVHQLAQRGYVETVRGKGGGLRLAMAPEDIHLSRVLEGAEGGVALLDCLDREGICCIQPSCRLMGILREAQQAMYAVLEKYTLADLLAEEIPLAALLHRERPAQAG
jgi:Rrf2 family transcriptional regulator, nitric oxide-sensitive transcriptional repressor